MSRGTSGSECRQDFRPAQPSERATPKLLTSFATAIAFLACTSMAHAQASAPNVVVLLADDLGWQDIGCYGGPVKTPALDSLAAKGVRFTNFYSGAPVCSPARATLLTGRHHLRTGVYTVIQDHIHNMHLLKSEVTIAEILKANGYDTVHLGKWHLGTPFRGWKKPWIDEHGFDYWFATDLNAAPSHRNPSNFWRNRERVGELKGYACQLVVDEAITWLDQKRDAEKPFFLNIWFHEPLAPLAAPV
jgi:arylsulfatase A